MTNPSTGDAGAAGGGRRRARRRPRAWRPQREALEAWGRLSPVRPQPGAAAVAEGIERNAETLALLESVDVGKPLDMARGEVAYAVECFDYYASLAVQIEGSTRHFDEGLGMVRREPVGTVGIITPVQLPAHAQRGEDRARARRGLHGRPQAVRAHAARRRWRWRAIVREAGLPPGAYNVVTAAETAAGAALVRHPDVAKIVFTGSTAVGVEGRGRGRAHGEAGDDGARRQVGEHRLRDADPEQAAARAHAAYTFNAGQYCESGSRLLVDSAVHDELLERLPPRPRRRCSATRSRPARRWDR